MYFIYPLAINIYNEVINNEGKMNDQKCIFKRYLTSCSADGVFVDKDLTGIRKQKVIASSKLCYMAWPSEEKIECH